MSSRLRRKNQKKRLLMRVGIGALVLMAAATAWSLLRPADPPAQTLTKPAAQPQPAPVEWDGRGVRDLRATYLVGGRQIRIEKVVYAGLDTPRTSMVVHAVVTPVSRRQEKALTRSMRLASSTGAITPAVKVRANGKTRRMWLTFRKVPTAQLNGRWSLQIRYPGSSAQGILLAMLAPEPPPNAIGAQ